LREKYYKDYGGPGAPEGNMADEREFDEVRTARMIYLFVTEALGLKKVA
jgi:hypothetical protein